MTKMNLIVVISRAYLMSTWILWPTGTWNKHEVQYYGTAYQVLCNKDLSQQHKWQKETSSLHIVLSTVFSKYTYSLKHQPKEAIFSHKIIMVTIYSATTLVVIILHPWLFACVCAEWRTIPKQGKRSWILPLNVVHSFSPVDVTEMW